MIINKEKIVCALGVLLFIAGVIFTVSNWSVSTKVVSVPAPDPTVVVVPTQVKNPRTLQPGFETQIQLIYPRRRSNPFQAPHGRRQVFASDYPLPLPWDKPVKKNVPVPGTFTNERFRPSLMQAEPPEEQKHLRRKKPRAGSGEEEGEEEDDEDEDEDEDEEEDEKSVDPNPVLLAPSMRRP